MRNAKRPPGDLVRVSKPDQRAAASGIVTDTEILREVDDLLGHMRPHFSRVEPFIASRRYILSCASDLPKLNGWTISEHSGYRSPDKIQRLLAKARWDDNEVFREIRRYVVAKLDAVARHATMRVLALDESGQEKSGAGTAGVKRQYMGCAGRVANGINTVYMTYVRQHAGHALIGARQWIPREHIDDPDTAQRMGLPDDLTFATKGQIAVNLVQSAHADGISVDFVTGDEVYGASPDLRRYCEESGTGYVLRVAKTFPISLRPATTLTCEEVVKKLLHRKRDWTVLSAGAGSKGERLYAWAWIATESPQHFLLIRRHIRTGECAYHYCHVPDGEKATLHRLVTAAGLRWPVEECFEFGKDYFGLDQSQVRLYRSIKRHTVLAAATLAIFAVIAAQKRRATDTQAPPPTNSNDIPPSDPGLIPLTIREIKSLFNAVTRRAAPAELTAHWSRWRRRHQARARWFHQRTRLARSLTLAQVKP
jgi:SRSO17 transposase